MFEAMTSSPFFGLALTLMQLAAQFGILIECVDVVILKK